MTSMDSGTAGVLHISDGDPNLLNANRNDDGRWLNAYYDNPDNRWNRENGFAFVASQLFSFSPYLGEFCFVTLPYHPPSIFPILSHFNERAVYFLLSKVLVSQRSNRVLRTKTKQRMFKALNKKEVKEERI